MLEFLPYVGGVFVLSFFGWLRYRSYLRFLRHVYDRDGMEGLKATDQIARPGFNIDADLVRWQLPQKPPDATE